MLCLGMQCTLIYHFLLEGDAKVLLLQQQHDAACRDLIRQPLTCSLLVICQQDI